MSEFSAPLVADSVARVLAALGNRAPRPRREFADLAVDSSVVSVPTRHGGVKCTVYRPPAAVAGRPPAYVNIHGGGFVIRYPEQDDPWCRYLAAHAGVAVINVDYDTAPRHRFPVPVEEAYDVVGWASAAERDWDGGRLCVGGQSAGGSLTAAVARLALEHGGPAIALQVLHYAVLDLVTAPRDKPAPAGKAAVPVWLSEVFDGAYIRDPAQRRHYLASPAWGANADGIEGIAPALVVTAERDRLRAEAAAYASRLEAAGSLVAYHEVPGVDHGYDVRGESPEATRQAYEFIAGHVARAVSMEPLRDQCCGKYISMILYSKLIVSLIVMDDGQPSFTALTAAAARAAHLIVDDEPLIFADPLAADLLGDRAGELIGFHTLHGAHPVLAGARVQAACRSRYTEDALGRAVSGGVTQYVILGTGLDSFAYRDGLAGQVRVFEVDHPATQGWKRRALAAAKVPVPDDVTFIPADLAADSLAGRLAAAGFDAAAPALVSWLGGTMYLTPDSVAQVMTAIGGFAPGTELIADYMLPEDMRDEAGSGGGRTRCAPRAWPCSSTAGQNAGFSRARDPEPAIEGPVPPGMILKPLPAIRDKSFMMK